MHRSRIKNVFDKSHKPKTWDSYKNSKISDWIFKEKQKKSILKIWMLRIWMIIKGSGRQ